ncbi:MAG: Lrp/AsnC family transcriptional regulator [Candidatus Woesearchaeota archaeon]
MSSVLPQKAFQGEILSRSEKIKLDLIDRKILYLLALNSRLSYTALAKTLKTTREVIAYRIKRLEEEQFLEGFFTMIDTMRFGYQLNMIYVKLSNTANNADIISFLNTIPEVTRIKDCAGDYDLQVIFSTKTLEEFDSALEKLLNKLSSTIKDYTVLRIVEEGYLGLNLLLTPEERKGLTVREAKGSAFQKEFDTAKKTEEVISIDDIDKKILNILKLDARIPIKDISKKIKLSPIAIDNRIKRLVKEKVILSMYPLFDISRMGYQWYKVFFQVRNVKKHEFVEYLKQHDNVLWYVKLIGRWNYQFSVFAHDNIEFHKILNDIRARFPENIMSYDSLIIMNQHKFVHRID